MARIQFTPWKEHSQLAAVRDQFYPPPGYQGPDMRASASALVWTWKIRGNLPHTVEATALLTDAILHDDASKNSIFSIRATYSSAFCRFVTGLVDSKLHGRKQSMYQKAMAVGVPASFVELRHEATHRDLPSLAVLRNAAQRSLEWLWEFYWAKIENVTCAGGDGDGESGDFLSSRSNERELSEAIWYVLQPLTAKRTGLNGVSKEKKTTESIRELVVICERERGAGALLARTLLRPGVLIPETRSLGDRMDHSISTWDEFLKEICRHHTPFLTQFVEEMTTELVSSTTSETEKDSYREGIYAWFKYILESSSWTLLRRQYLLLSYVQVVCRDGGGYWGDRLHDLIEITPNGLDLAAAKDDMIMNGTDDELKGPSLDAAQKSGNESDVEALRSYGWDLNRGRSFKPIGVA